MGLFRSLIKAAAKIVVAPVAIAGDIITHGAFMVSDKGTLTERATKGLDKDLSSISREIDKL